MRDKARLHAQVIGSGGGVPIVMLHGWGQNLSSLRPLAELLSDLAEIHLLDLPGFGLSSAASASGEEEVVWGVSEFTQAVLDYVAEKRWSKVILIGHSLGGRIALMATSRYPELVDKTVLIASAGLPPKRSFREKLRLYYIKLLRGAIRLLDRLIKTDTFKSWFVPRFGSADYLAAGEMRKSLVKVVNEDLTSFATKISRPVLILWGSEDNETPLEMGERLSRMIQGARLKVIPGEGHYVFLGAGTHVCAHAIRKFLK